MHYLHPSSRSYLQPGYKGISLNRKTQTSLSTETSSSSVGETPKWPAERHGPSCMSLVLPWAFSHQYMPGIPPQEGSRRDARATSIIIIKRLPVRVHHSLRKGFTVGNVKQGWKETRWSLGGDPWSQIPRVSSTEQHEGQDQLLSPKYR